MKTKDTFSVPLLPQPLCSPFKLQQCLSCNISIMSQSLALCECVYMYLYLSQLHCIPFLFSPSEPSDNFREILQNVAKPHGVSNMRKLGHLNNFIKVSCCSMSFVELICSVCAWDLELDLQQPMEYSKLCI